MPNLVDSSVITGSVEEETKSLAAKLRRLVFGISTEETSFARRGFHWRDDRAREHLERAGQAFVGGYNAALVENRPEPLAERLRQVETDKVGFAFEGAAMALTVQDYLAPWKRNRLTQFLQGPGTNHVYMVHVGAGWAIARLRRPLKRPMQRMDPLLRWLVVDGFGFHEGYFHPLRSIARQDVPRRITGYARRAFDQGLGRSLWFVCGADVERIYKTICSFAPPRQADLFSGIGLAATYAGGVDIEHIKQLKALGVSYRAQLAQGAAFAAKARLRAAIMTEHTNLACEVLCGVGAEAAAAVTDEALQNLPADGSEPSYEVWRYRILAEFSGQRVVS